MRCENRFIPNSNPNVSFPCGQCYDCRMERAKQWGFRLLQEGRVSNTAFFLTLTYDTEHLPLTKYNGRFKRMTLYKKHLQNWLKVIRQTQVRYHKKLAEKTGKPYKLVPIKYYAAGEYGSKGTRPHYHIIIFNADLEIIIGEANAKMALSNIEIYLQGKYNYVDTYWNHGHISVGQVNEASIMYALKYISKYPLIYDKHDKRQPEFALMSKGLGQSYLTEKNIAWHYSDIYNRYFLPYQGYKIQMPRYYRKPIYGDGLTQDIGEYQEKRHQEHIKQMTPAQLKRYETNKAKRLEVGHNKMKRNYMTEK